MIFKRSGSNKELTEGMAVNVKSYEGRLEQNAAKVSFFGDLELLMWSIRYVL